MPNLYPTDFDLARRCLRGERAAQEAPYARFAPRLLAVACRYAPTRAAAEDVLQDALIRAFASLEQYRGEGALEAWLRRIVVRTAINHFHAAAARPAEAGLDEAAHLTTDDYDILARLAADDLRALIQRLPTGYRLVLNLYCIEGYTHTEIAALLGIDERMSSSQLAKARRRLLALLRHAEYAPDYDSC